MDTAHPYIAHCPIMPQEIYGFLADEQVFKALQDKLFVDLTLGYGGHARFLLDRYPSLKLLAFDQDPQAIKHAQEDLLPLYGQRLTLALKNFKDAPTILAPHSCAHILLDLGVSTHQLLAAERGFSWGQNGPLDMRMNQEALIPTAADLVNNLSEAELTEIFLNYGEEPLAPKIAAAICHARQQAPLRTTQELENIVFHCYPPKWRHGRTHPATKVFQGLRIKVNQELEILAQTLPALLPCLAVGGRLSVLSFHSLEDRIVKQCFLQAVQGLAGTRKSKNKYPPRDAKVDAGLSAPLASSPSYELVTKKPWQASAEELAANHRARSAKLRIIIRVS